jgi:hypothetical protein
MNKLQLKETINGDENIMNGTPLNNKNNNNNNNEKKKNKNA